MNTDLKEVEARATLLELFRFFLQMGMTAFGGPIAHFAVLEREAISRRNWMTRDEFLDVMGLLNLIPGPNSTQMVMYFGYRQKGVLGMLAAGFGFIFPAVIITLSVTQLYILYGDLPQGQALLFGIQPVVVAIIASALWSFLPKGVTSWETGSIFVMALVAVILGVNETFVILAAGAVGWAWFSTWRPPALGMLAVVPGTVLAADSAITLAPSLSSIFAVYTKMALTLYGTGYLLVAYMKADLVDALGWLSNQDLLDAIAIGQMTPGPFLTTAASTGMLIAGFPGAVAGTFAIFLPSFFLIGLLGGKVSKLRSSEWGMQLLKGINAAVVAVLMFVAFSFSLEIADHWFRLVVAALALIAVQRYRINSMLLVVIGGFLGFIWQHMIL